MDNKRCSLDLFFCLFGFYYCVCVCVCVRVCLSMYTSEVLFLFTHQRTEVCVKYRGTFPVTSECIPHFMRVQHAGITWFKLSNNLGRTSNGW